MNFLKWLGFRFKQTQKQETSTSFEPPKDSYKDSLWYVSGINDNKPILKVEKLENGYITAEFIEENNKGKIHYQELQQFLMCFDRY